MREAVDPLASRPSALSAQVNRHAVEQLLIIRDMRFAQRVELLFLTLLEGQFAARRRSRT